MPSYGLCITLNPKAQFSLREWVSRHTDFLTVSGGLQHLALGIGKIEELEGL